MPIVARVPSIPLALLPVDSTAPRGKLRAGPTGFDTQETTIRLQRVAAYAPARRAHASAIHNQIDTVMEKLGINADSPVLALA